MGGRVGVRVGCGDGRVEGEGVRVGASVPRASQAKSRKIVSARDVSRPALPLLKVSSYAVRL